MPLCCRVIASRLDAALLAVPLGTLPALYLLGQNLFPIRMAQSIACIHDLNLAPISFCYQMGFIERTPEDQLLVQFQGMISEYERAQILERSRRGKRHRAQSGEVSVMSGAPYGYRYIRKTNEAPAAYAVLETEARVVVRIYEMYTVEGLSIGEITRRLNAEGIPTRKASARWERTTVWAVLRNSAYRGIACFGKTRASSRTRVMRSQRRRGVITPSMTAGHERPREEWIGPLDGGVVAGIRLHPSLILVGPARQNFLADHRLANYVVKEIRHLRWTGQSAQITVDHNTVKTVVYKEQQAAKQPCECLHRSSSSVLV